MNRVRFLVCMITVLISTSKANNKQLPSTLKEESSNKVRSARVSSEFGYNVQNSDGASSHFRQEHRDVNGVVRGSYGFKNPDGAFRFVHYVADDNGFRAQVSSNEQGVGGQNPSSVNINRFEHDTEDINGRAHSKPHTFEPRRQNSAYEALLQRYKYYSPQQASTDFRTSSNQNSAMPNFGDNDPYRYDILENKFRSKVQPNPVGKLIRTNFGLTGERFPSTHQKDGVSENFPWNFNPNSRNPFNHQYFPDRNTHIDFFNPLYDSVNTPSNNHKEVAKVENSLKNPSSQYTPFLQELFSLPQHKIHTSLPDCSSVSSAMLCKPPMLFYRRLLEKNNPRKDDVFHDKDLLGTSASHMLFPEEQSQIPEYQNSLKQPDLTDKRSQMLLPHLVPNSYPVRSDVYKKFLNYFQEYEDSVKQRKECQKHDHRGNSEDHEPHLESLHFKKDAVRNDFSRYNTNRDVSSSSKILGNIPTDISNDRDKEFYSSLVKIIQNDESLKKLKDLLWQTSQASADSNAETSPKLSLLGVLILPSHIVKELDQAKKPDVKNEPESFDEKNLSEFGDEMFESDIIDENQNYFENNDDYYTDRNSEKIKTIEQSTKSIEQNNTVDSSKSSINETNELRYDLPINVQPVYNNPLHTDQNGVNQTSIAPDIDNSKQLTDHELSNTDTVTAQNLSSSSDNWRKILEEEISKELSETLMNHEDPQVENTQESLKNPREDTHHNSHQYSLNKHIGPLFDSTGKLLEPDNVPIHIHRFNPPTGLSSIPWTYAIPRPAPPRSIVVPPKPTLLL